MSATELGVGEPTDLFHCPIEGGDRSFVRLAAGRIGHLLSKVDPERFESDSVIRCEGCGATFDSAVLDVVTNHEIVRRTDLAARVLFGALIRATPNDADVRTAALDSMLRWTVRPGSASDLLDLPAFESIANPLRDAAEVLHESARLAMLEAAIEVSVGGGKVRARHLGVLVHAGEAFGVRQVWIRDRIVSHRRSR